MVVFRIGWKPDGNGGWGVRSTGQSVEHNTDLYAALLRLSNVYADRGNADQRELWRSDALWAGDWVVNKMYDDAAGRFYLGTACDNGVCAADTFHYALDVQTWTYLVFSQSPDFGGLRDWTRQLRWAEEKLAFNKGTVSGFDFGYNANAADRTPDGVWVEGTAQMALAYLLAGETDHYRATLLALEQLAQRQPGALVVAADRDGLSTGIDLSDGNPWQLFSRGALGATAWMLFAEAGYNPFWSAAAIPASAGYFHTAGRDIVSDTGDLKTVFRGVNLPGLDYGVFQQDFSNGPTIASSQPYPGVLGTNYFAPRPEDLNVIAARGFNLVRVPLEWGRLVTDWTPDRPVMLNESYVGFLDHVVQTASQLGLYVIPELHDQLVYWAAQGTGIAVNNSPVHQALLAETWRLLAQRYANNSTILGYDLMNEPDYRPGDANHWFAIAQATVAAIRQVDQRHLVFIEGTDYSKSSQWPLEQPLASVVDSVTPPRLVYSPHVYFDYDNSSQYSRPGEETGPLASWQYYVRDRLAPAIDWSIQNNVPLFIGETGTPSTAAWRDVMNQAFRSFFEPLHLSVAAWQYVNPAHSPSDPLNLARFPAGGLLDTLDDFPGGTYATTAPFQPVPTNTLLYDDRRVNPWQADGANVGWWGPVVVNSAAVSPVVGGQHSLSVQFQGGWGGLKFVHDFGIDASRFAKLAFYLYPTSTDLNFRFFTTGPLPQSAEYPDAAHYADRRALTDFLEGPLVPNRWQLVQIPLAQILPVGQPVITGIGFQDDDGADPVFYLDQVMLIPEAKWHNTNCRSDVTGLDGVTPLDILIVINYINLHPADPALPASPAVPPPYYDVNDDGYVTPQDVLIPINDINNHAFVSGEGEAVEAPGASAVVAAEAPLRIDSDRASISCLAWSPEALPVGSEQRNSGKGPAQLAARRIADRGVERLAAREARPTVLPSHRWDRRTLQAQDSAFSAWGAVGDDLVQDLVQDRL